MSARPPARTYRRSASLKRTYREDVRLIDTPLRRGLVAVGLAAALAAPLLLSSFWLHVVSEGLILLLAALALNLLIGETGQISLGHAAFVGSGAFVAAATNEHFGLGVFVGLPLAAVVGAVIGFLVGLPALRLKGLYLAVSTLAAHFVLVALMTQYQSARTFGGGFTLEPVAVLGWTLTDSVHWYWVLLALVLAGIVIHWNIQRSAYGRIWRLIKTEEAAAAALGVRVRRFKLLAFVFSTSVTAIAGALLAYYLGFVSIEQFGFEMLISFLAIVIIGGLGSVSGCVLGAAVVVLLPHVLERIFETVPFLPTGAVFEVRLGVFGVLILVFLIVEPGGLRALWGRVHRYLALWPFRYRSWEA